MEEEKITPQDLIDISKLDSGMKETARAIIDENATDKLQSLINMFNLQELKKNTIRATKYNELLDKISSEMLARFEKYHNQFSTDDIIKYLQATQLALEKSKRTDTTLPNIPNITVNQVNIQNNSEQVLTREERENILTALKAIQTFTTEDAVIEPENIIIEESELKGEPLLNGDDGNNNNQN